MSAVLSTLQACKREMTCSWPSDVKCQLLEFEGHPPALLNRPTFSIFSLLIQALNERHLAAVTLGHLVVRGGTL